MKDSENLNLGQVSRVATNAGCLLKSHDLRESNDIPWPWEALTSRFR